jgi:hypothetical protein
LKVTSQVIRGAMLSYLRFKRQWVCAYEVQALWGIADILVQDSKNMIHDIEIKVCLSDLKGHEPKKRKHRGMAGDTRLPNKFSLCVPTKLAEEAKKVIEELNPKYGLFCVDTEGLKRSAKYGYTPLLGQYVHTARTAKPLHTEDNPKYRGYILKRLSAIAAGGCEKEAWEDLKKNVGTLDSSTNVLHPHA